MEYIIFAAAIIAAFLVGAYVRKPFAIIHKKAEVESPESVVNAKEKEKEKNEIIREEMEKLLSYTGRKREGDAE
jgi:hypothetical protein